MTARVPKPVFAVLVCLVVLGGASVAQGATVTVGSLRTDITESTTAGSPGSIGFANLLVGSGGTAASPVDGVIVNWHLTGAVGGPFFLRVLRPSGGGVVGVGRSAGALPTGLTTQTFTTNLPIRAGDLIGLDTTNKTDEVGAVAALGSQLGAWVPPAPEGVASFPTVTASNAEIAFNAEVQPPPKIVAVSPAKGSIAGGASVTLTGSDFSGATSITFGGVPVALFPAQSDSSLTVVAPKVKKPGPVDITVTTAAGTSAAGVKFTYVACKVPKLKGKTVKAAKKALKKANCKVGTLSGKGAKVVKQGVKAGTIRPPGAKVGLKRGES